MKKILENLEEMEKFAQSIANEISSNRSTADFGGAMILALYGDLGSGKTTFTKSFIASFGVEQTVTSPTFVIEKIYKIPNGKNFEYIIHIDAYRLNSGEELKDLGWDEILNNPKNIILIEWPEKIADILPENTRKIEFEFVDENRREVNY